ncbi:FCD domain-containing protein [Pseudarthrobacter psychrotolerans]|uniref:FCD domain-containing protein n=1 Tax=Pseudarthrobacter psychrotolerans TaxID=2697569 RepID=A0A6P1NTR8_9MICC|nr:FCD domain-containing protein [Pseudarthrobacter psychrotolerans]QHK20201.1 FCD domain-containing protein [Pseudarthrobacter psychrotolerans]
MEEDLFETRGPILRPARHGNAFEETIERLLQNIKLGLFGVGAKLPAERELAEMLGVSRATLRDALAELQKAGYVEVQRGRYGGTYVCSRPSAGPGAYPELDRAEVEDVLTFRSVLEPAAASLAAKATLSPAQRSHLLKTLAEVASAPADLYRPKDARFHVAIAEVTGSPSLALAVADVRSRVSDLLDRIPLLEPNLEHSNRQHQEIMDAILRGDHEEAFRSAQDHLQGTASLLHGFLGSSQTDISLQIAAPKP